MALIYGAVQLVLKQDLYVFYLVLAIQVLFLEVLSSEHHRLVLTLD